MQNAAFRALGLDAVVRAAPRAPRRRRRRSSRRWPRPAAAATSPSRTRRRLRARVRRATRAGCARSARATPSGARTAARSSATTPTSRASSAALDAPARRPTVPGCWSAPAGRRARSAAAARERGAALAVHVARRGARARRSSTLGARSSVCAPRTPARVPRADQRDAARTAAPETRSRSQPATAPAAAVGARPGVSPRARPAGCGARARGGLRGGRRARGAGAAGRGGVLALVSREAARRVEVDARRRPCRPGLTSPPRRPGAGALAPSRRVPPLPTARCRRANGTRSSAPLCRAAGAPVPPPWCARCGQPGAGGRRVPLLRRLAARRSAGVRSAVWLDGLGARGGASPQVRRLAAAWRRRWRWRCAGSSRCTRGAVLVPVPLVAEAAARARLQPGGGTGAARWRGVAGSVRGRDAAARARDTPTQTALTPEARAANVAGAFMAPALVQGHLCSWTTCSPPARRSPRRRRRCGGRRGAGGRGDVRAGTAAGGIFGVTGTSPVRAHTRERVMALKVGINGFGRIGRNVVRAAQAAGRQGHRLRRGERPHRHHDAGAPAQVRLGARPLHGRRSRRRGDAPRWSTATRCGSSRRRIPPSCRGRTWASTSCSSPPAGSPTATRRRSTSTAGAKKVIISAPAKERGHHHRLRRQPHEVRPGEAPRHLQRQLHHELPGAGGEGDPRRVRVRAAAS